MEQVVERFELLAGYKDGSGVIHKTVTFREITGAEEEAIAKPGIRERGGLVVKTILERCITGIGELTPASEGQRKWSEIISNLLLADQDYAVSQIRCASLGSEVEMKHKCPQKNCNTEIDTILDLMELPIAECGEVWDIPFSLPRGIKTEEGVQTEGHLRMPIGVDREVLEPVARQNPGTANTMLLTRCITDLSGIKVTDQLVRNMSLKDREYLLKLMREHSFGLKLETEITCPLCGYSFDAQLNMTSFF